MRRFPSLVSVVIAAEWDVIVSTSQHLAYLAVTKIVFCKVIYILCCG
jgi:hypothetical protein